MLTASTPKQKVFNCFMDLPLSVLSQVAAILEKRGSFNAIHFDSVFKVDIFIPKGDSFGMAELDRRELRKISPDSDETVFVATAEDTILAKLRCNRAGNETSSNQWNDVVGILGTSLHTLDFDYLRTCAEDLELTDLFEKALNNVREESGE